MTKRTAHLYLVNALTMFRFVAALVMIPLAQQGYWMIILILAIFAFISDWLDGKLARRLKIVSGFGKFIDPLADKAVNLTLVWIIAWNYNFELVYVIPACIMLAYDVSMVSIRLLNQKSTGKMKGASSLAKVKTASQMTALGVLIFGIGLCDEETAGRVVQRAGIILLIYSSYLTLRSWYNYRELYSGLWQK